MLGARPFTDTPESAKARRRSAFIHFEGIELSDAQVLPSVGPSFLLGQRGSGAAGEGIEDEARKSPPSSPFPHQGLEMNDSSPCKNSVHFRPITLRCARLFLKYWRHVIIVSCIQIDVDSNV